MIESRVKGKPFDWIKNIFHVLFQDVLALTELQLF